MQIGKEKPCERVRVDVGVGVGVSVGVSVSVGSIFVGVDVAVELLVGLAVGVSVSVIITTGVVGRLVGVEVGGGGGVKTNLPRIASRMSAPMPMGIAYLRSRVENGIGAGTTGSPVYPSTGSRLFRLAA